MENLKDKLIIKLMKMDIVSSYKTEENRLVRELVVCASDLAHSDFERMSKAALIERIHFLLSKIDDETLLNVFADSAAYMAR
jgi:hypothetical protein